MEAEYQITYSALAVCMYVLSAGKEFALVHGNPADWTF